MTLSLNCIDVFCRNSDAVRAAANTANEMNEIGRRFHISMDEDEQSTSSSQNQVSVCFCSQHMYINGVNAIHEYTFECLCLESE